VVTQTPCSIARISPLASVLTWNQVWGRKTILTDDQNWGTGGLGYHSSTAILDAVQQFMGQPLGVQGRHICGTGSVYSGALYKAMNGGLNTKTFVDLLHRLSWLNGFVTLCLELRRRADTKDREWYALH
jgi:hypothetical protein